MLDKVLAPLRSSRVARIPYVENIQSGYHDAEKFARSKASALVRHPPKAMRLFANRYVLISLAAGACLFAANRFRRWRNNNHHPSPGLSAARVRTTAKPRTAARKSTRTATRTRMH